MEDLYSDIAGMGENPPVNTGNPTEDVDISFEHFVQERTRKMDTHLEGGIPDYAFASDFMLRQKLKSIPGSYPFFKALTSVYVPRQRQEMNINGVLVGPSQYSKLYDMTVSCAKTLGIGIPTVYVVNSVGTMNAKTFAYEDAEPIIVVYSALMERMTDDELFAVIGHECGHIHNNHGIYNTAANFLIQAGSLITLNIPIIQQILQLVSVPLQMALQAWSRAAEITCDRAGAICCGNENAAMMVDAKLASGAMFGQQEIDIDALIKQYDSIRATPVRMIELSSTHPVSVRRIIAIQEFFNSDVYYSWRQEQKKPGMQLYSKQELDARCDRIVSVTKSKER